MTFTPSDKTYSGEVAPVDVQATGSNGVKVQTTYTPIITPVTPTAEASATSDVQGKKQTSSIVLDTQENSADKDKTVNFNKGSQVGANGERVNLNPDTLTLLNDAGDEVSTLTTSDGEYVLDKVSKTITFTPNKTFTGQAKAVRVQIKDANGTKVETTYTPTVTKVTPTGINATSSGLQGKVQTGKPVFNGGVPEVPMNDEVPATLEGADQDGKVVIAGKGTYTVAKDGTVTFTPDKNFVGEAPAVTVKRVDINGTIATATYTPTVTDVSMTSENKTSEAPQGKTQTGTPTFTISTPDVRITEYKLVDPTNNTPVEEVEVENQGTYSIDKATGEVTFILKPGFTGPTTGITVRATDENGETKDATYTPSVTPLKVTPDNKTTTNIQGLPQEATPTFKLPKGVTNAVVTERKLIDPSTKALTNSVTVDGKGTFTINANGKVTFTPVPSYVGDVPAIEVQGTITVLNDNNDSTTITSKASYKPIIVPIELEKTPAESTNVQGLVQKGTPTFTPQSVDVNGVEKTVTVKPNSYKLVKDGTETDSIPAYKKDTQEVIGKYTIDPQTGEVTFTPTDKTYTGEVEPATVQATGSNNVKVQTTYTPIIKPVKPVGTNAGSEGIQGAPQSGTPSFKSGNENIPMTVSATNPAKLVDPTTNQPIEATEIDAKNAAGEKVGLYTINPATGEVTFTPNPGFSGTPVPATVQAKDGNGTPTTATYTPVVKAAVPSGDNQVTSDIQGAKQTVTPVFTPGKNTVNNQEVSVPFEATSKAKLIDPSKTGDEREVTTLVVENQGTYTIDDNGVVTFTPLPTFKGEATAVSIVRKDKNGTPATATYTPTFTEVNPTGADSATTGLQGLPQTSRVVLDEKDETDKTTVNFNAGHEKVTLKQDTLTLVNAAGDKVTTVTVPDVGTYELKDGVITFTPLKTFKGKTEGVTVQVEDANGKVIKQKYVPTVVDVLPTGKDTTSTGLQGKVQTGKPEFTPGSPEVPMNDEVPATFEDGNITKTVEKVGTYTVAKDGTVTFTPDKDFVGEAPEVTVKRVDKNGTAVTAKYKPTVTKVTPTGKDTTSTGLQGKVQTGTPVFTPGSPEVPMDDEVPATFEDGNITKKVDKVGTYTVAKDGTVTFTPEKDFVGEAPEVTVKRVDKNGTAVTAKYKPIVAKVLPTGEGSETEGAKGKPQTSRVVFDKKDEDKSTVNFNKGDETVALNPSTLTLVDKNGNPSTEVKVPGEGTYTLANNVITFTPEKDFNGKATGVTVQVKDSNGTSIEKTYTPTVRAVTPTPSTPVTPTPSTPSKEKDSLTIWKDGDGNNIKSPEQGKKEPLTIDGYIYERSEVDKEGNTVHIYRKVSSETPVVNEKETLFVDANGKPLQPAKKGQHPHETIPGYEFVRTETDANGNVRHVYRPVAQSQATVNPSPTVEQRKNELPNTGTGDEFAIFGAAAASILAGLGIAIPGKKKEEEK